MRYFIKAKLVFLLSFACFFLFAKDFTRKERKLIEKYSSFLTKGTQVDSVGYHFICEKKDSTFITKIFNPDKLVKTHEIKYSSAHRILKHGIYKEWYDNGNIWKKGKYLYGKKNGLWRYYSYEKKGKQIETGVFLNDKKEGVWTKQGEKKRTIYHYKNGKKNGLMEVYKGDSLIEKKLYKDGKVDSIILENKEHKKLPRYKYGKKALIQKIGKRINFPNEAIRKNIEGKVVIKFVVEKDGTIGEIVVLRGVCKSIEKQAIKAIKRLPKFENGEKDGKPVRVWFKVPLIFKFDKNRNTTPFGL